MSSKFQKIEEKLKALRKEAKEDCVVNRKKLDTAFDNTEKVMKWIDRKVDWNLLVKELERNLSKTKRELFEFYRKDYPLKLDSAAELNMMITSDDQYIALEREMVMAEAVQKFIGHVIETLKARAWEIKGICEYQKFIHGA